MVPDRARDNLHPDNDAIYSDAIHSDAIHSDAIHNDAIHIDAAATRPTATWSDWSCTVRLVVSDPKVLAEAVALVRTRMRQIETAASRFVVDSDLNWANANTGRPIAVPSLLIELVEAALDGGRRSGGALDPTIGRHLAAIGYDRDILLVGDDDRGGGGDGETRAVVPEHIQADPSGHTWRDVVVDREMGLLTVPRGTAVDLGATAKAQTADWVARAIHQRYGVAVMVEIGGDLAVAGHLVDADGVECDWQVDVAERAGGWGQRIGVRRGGVATSSTTIRAWRRGGLRMHHIIDPRIGRPADGPWRTVSVAAESALEANACSTAAIVLGERALSWLQAQGVAARLVDQQGRVSVLGGWPADRPAEPGVGAEHEASATTEAKAPLRIAVAPQGIASSSQLSRR